MKRQVLMLGLVALGAFIDVRYAISQWQKGHSVFTIIALLVLVVVLIVAAVTRLGAKPLVTRPTKRSSPTQTRDKPESLRSSRGQA